MGYVASDTLLQLCLWSEQRMGKVGTAGYAITITENVTILALSMILEYWALLTLEIAPPLLSLLC